ncbi:glycosyltransferase [Bacillus wiedmannii]|uniref:glycosyltransferase n=1 Tax=Bacillus wiedmannii TaxID=1890302 RepID=UPI000BF021E3|nr:glycosyltransferase [Bacillus wiedmannii]PEJ62247.1 hypothetical protein CN685_26400 [Bacillus wiedmannii]
MEKPLVSILIPVTGNSIYLELALTSVLLQTYTNIEIIIRDPTPTDAIQTLLEKEFLPYSNRITYIKDNRYMPRVEILHELLRVSQGEYINFLREEDLFYPEKIEKMMNYFFYDVNNSIKLITSNTELIDRHGNLVDDFKTINKIHKTDGKWDSTVGSNLILKHKNYIGGLSVPLFRKKDLIQPFGVFSGHQFIKEIELASWLTLVSQGECVFIEEDLIFERKNHNYKITMDLVTDWIHFIKLIIQNDYKITKSTQKYIFNKVLGWIEHLLSNSANKLTIIEREKIFEYKEYLYELKAIK